MQFSASASSTLDPDIPSPSDGSVPLVHVNPAFGCRVCSSPLPVSGCRCRERRGGEEVRTGWPAWICSPLVIFAACTAASLTSTATWADFHGLHWVKHRLVPSIPAWHATRPLPFLSTAASPHRQHAGSRFSRPRPHFDPALWHWDNVVWDCLPTAATIRCAWFDEVLRDSVEWWTFTQSFASSASILMLQMQRRWLASEALVSFAW